MGAPYGATTNIGSVCSVPVRAFPVEPDEAGRRLWWCSTHTIWEAPMHSALAIVALVLCLALLTLNNQTSSRI